MMRDAWRFVNLLRALTAVVRRDLDDARAASEAIRSERPSGSEHEHRKYLRRLNACRRAEDDLWALYVEVDSIAALVTDAHICARWGGA